MFPKNPKALFLAVLTLAFAFWSYAPVATAADSADDAGKVVPATTSPTADDCEPLLKSQVKVVLRSTQVFTQWQANVAPSWYAAQDGKLYLASQNKAGLFQIYSPLEGTQPSVSAQLSGIVSHVRWIEEGAAIKVVVGDDRGTLSVFTLGNSTPLTEFLGSFAEVLPSVFKDASGNPQMAVGLAEMQRVRIMPVGRFVPQKDLQVAGRLEHTVVDVVKGQPLLAAASETSVDVFNLTGAQTAPMVTLSLSGGVRTQIAFVKDENDSASLMIGQSSGSLVWYSFDTDRAAALFGNNADMGQFLTLRRQDGSTIVLSGSEFHVFTRGALIAGNETKPGGLALLEGPEARTYALHMVESKLILRELGRTDNQTIAWILNPGETLLHVRAQRLSTTQHMLAVQTDQRLLVLDLSFQTDPAHH